MEDNFIKRQLKQLQNGKFLSNQSFLIVNEGKVQEFTQNTADQSQLQQVVTTNQQLPNQQITLQSDSQNLDQTFLPFIKQQDLGHLQAQWNAYTPNQQYMQYPDYTQSQDLPDEEESHSLFARDFTQINQIQHDIYPQQVHPDFQHNPMTNQYEYEQQYDQRNIAYSQQPLRQSMGQPQMVPEGYYPQEFISSELQYKDTRLPFSENMATFDHQQYLKSQQQMPHLRANIQQTGFKFQKEWSNEGKQVRIQGLSKEKYALYISNELFSMNISIQKEQFKKDDIIIKLSTESEAAAVVNKVYSLLAIIPQLDQYKVKVTRQLESIQEDDSDKVASGESSDKNERSNEFLAETQEYLNRELLDQDEEQYETLQVEEIKEEEAQQFFMQGSPFYPKNNPNFALSMTEKKTPLGFKGDYDAMKNQRAFTPLLDQMTTGISDEESHRFNLSFGQSNEPYHIFQQRQEFYHSEDSGSFHSAHANIPTQFRVGASMIRQNPQIRPQQMPIYPQQDIQYMSQLHQGMPISRHSTPLQQQPQFMGVNAQTPFHSFMIPQNQPGMIMDPQVQQMMIQRQSMPPQQQPQLRISDPQLQQMNTRNAMYPQQPQNTWPYQNYISPQQNPNVIVNPFNPSHQQQQQYYQNKIMMMEQIKLQQMQQASSRMFAQELKKQFSAPQETLPPLTTEQQQQLLMQSLSQMKIEDINKEGESRQEAHQAGLNLAQAKSSDQAKTVSSMKSSIVSQTTDDRTKNEINVYKILNNEEKRTTVMIRHIPNKFKQMNILDLLNAKYQGKYDYFYLPMDLKTQCNMGYAFINFVHPIYIIDFFLEFQSYEWSNASHDCKSIKMCNLAFANFQGKDELAQHHQDKNIMKKAEDYIKPLELDTIIVSEDEVKKIQERYKKMKQNGDLDRKIQKLLKKQKNKPYTSGPHPHHSITQQQPQVQLQQQTQVQIQKTSSTSVGQTGSFKEQQSQVPQSQQQQQHSVRQVTQHPQSRQQNLQYQGAYYGSGKGGYSQQQQSYYRGGGSGYGQQKRGGGGPSTSQRSSYYGAGQGYHGSSSGRYYPSSSQYSHHY